MQPLFPPDAGAGDMAKVFIGSPVRHPSSPTLQTEGEAVWDPPPGIQKIFFSSTLHRKTNGVCLSLSFIVNLLKKKSPENPVFGIFEAPQTSF